MGRTKKEVDPEALKQLILKLESERQFANHNELFKTVGAELKLTPSVIYLRVKEFDIPLKTPKGKKGNPNLGDVIKTGKKPKNTDPKAAAALQKEANHFGYGALAEKALAGSLKSCIKLNCILCTQNDKNEIRNCQVFNCAFFNVRPFKP